MSADDTWVVLCSPQHQEVTVCRVQGLNGTPDDADDVLWRTQRNRTRRTIPGLPAALLYALYMNFMDPAEYGVRVLRSSQ